VLHVVSLLPAGASWSATGIGRTHLPVTLSALALGGHVRTGFEDTIYYAKGRLATSNAELIARVSRIARETGREVATPDQAREILGIGGRGNE
jgi:3-keto-5-aminohexanoate cleavage enzyme